MINLCFQKQTESINFDFHFLIISLIESVIYGDREVSNQQYKHSEFVLNVYTFVSDEKKNKSKNLSLVLCSFCRPPLPTAEGEKGEGRRGKKASHCIL